MCNIMHTEGLEMKETRTKTSSNVLTLGCIGATLEGGVVGENQNLSHRFENEVITRPLYD